MRVHPQGLSLAESNLKHEKLAGLSDTAVREKERKNQVLVQNLIIQTFPKISMS